MFEMMIILFGWFLATLSLANIGGGVHCDLISNNTGAGAGVQEYSSLRASQHYNYVLQNGRCQWPQPRVVNVAQELAHLSARKKYIPHCTILHHCGPSTGCCRFESEHCAPKRQEEVKLYFWTIELTSRGHKKGIEVIRLQNHTECGCAPISVKHSLITPQQNRSTTTATATTNTATIHNHNQTKRPLSSSTMTTAKTAEVPSMMNKRVSTSNGTLT